MMARSWLLLAGFFSLPFPASHAVARPAELQAVLAHETIGPHLALSELQAYLETRIPRMPRVRSAAEWERQAAALRAETLARVVERGQAAAWRTAPTKVEWLETIAGGPGYRIRKLRYEALPGLWIPALLYEPATLAGKAPAVLNVNGHDSKGKAAPYKQIRCINLAKRGMLALNVEWLGMGQLGAAGFQHSRMNQLDLCGSSGLAPFYLSMKRGLDVLLAYPHADPRRVAVTGMSGGGWQTIFLSALDPRVTLTDPVAGYSSFFTRVRHFKDLGDSEQTPSDLATVADYTHLTALMAPRPTLLTFNSKDDCCFESGGALPPLLEAAGPIFQLYGKERFLRTHVNHDPGTHNYEKDNRQAFYRMLGDFFFAGAAKFNPQEIASDAEVKSIEALSVALPAGNADFHSLALTLARDLPHDPAIPTERIAARAWRTARRTKLRGLVRAQDYRVQAVRTGAETKPDGLRVGFWRFKVGDAWTVPGVELERGGARSTVILIADAGRRGTAAEVERLLAGGQRVLAVDPFYLGESKLEHHDSLFALLVSAVGERPLGLQASQLTALARWAAAEWKSAPLTLEAMGPRSSVAALVAAALEEQAIGGLELHGSFASLKEVLEQNATFEQMPELFCFGLLEAFDIPQLAALSGPRPVVFVRPAAHAQEDSAQRRREKKK